MLLEWRKRAERASPLGRQGPYANSSYAPYALWMRGAKSKQKGPALWQAL